MKFQVLSHAGLLVKSSLGKSLICDPWLVGSSYWRSWWNYPPVSKELVDSLKPDYIYLTHVHWDHFHGTSLNKFSKETPIIIPKGGYKRIKEDLNYLGFYNIIELKHGESKQLDKDFTITSYQVWMFLDSALLIQCEGTTLLNLNDSKHMGPTLRQITNKHKTIDFVFRSHSSANERLSYTIVDDPSLVVDDLEKYIEEFSLTVQATGAKYAIPFASNHCHLHKDSFHFNEKVQHPRLVEAYFAKKDIMSPKVVVMVSGDSWDKDEGFALTDKKWFDNREAYLQEYLETNSESLNKFYAVEDSTILEKSMVDDYFLKLSKSLPFFLKRFFKGKWFTYVLHTGGVPKYVYNVEISTGRVEEVENAKPLGHDKYPIQIHTTAYIFLRGIEYKIFSHMCIGKRVFYKVTKSQRKYMEMLNVVFNLVEYDMLPLSRNFTGRSIQSWLMRWRELLLYSMFVRDLVFYKQIKIAKYLKPMKQAI